MTFILQELKSEFEIDFDFVFRSDKKMRLETEFKIENECDLNMAREFAKSFYNSAAWRKTSKVFAASKFFLCEKCGHQGYIVHHKKPLTPENIGDPNITLSWSNLMYLCLECHNAIHGSDSGRKMIFDDDGNLINVIDRKPPRSCL